MKPSIVHFSDVMLRHEKGGPIMFRSVFRKLAKTGAAMIAGLWVGTLAVAVGSLVAGAPQRMVNTIIAAAVIGGTIGWAMTTQDGIAQGSERDNSDSDKSRSNGRECVGNRERRAATNKHGSRRTFAAE